MTPEHLTEVTQQLNEAAAQGRLFVVLMMNLTKKPHILL